jgi:hypothetical protein
LTAYLDGKEDIMADKRNMVIFAAAKEADISEKEMKNILVSHKDGCFEITFST